VAVVVAAAVIGDVCAGTQGRGGRRIFELRMPGNAQKPKTKNATKTFGLGFGF
jgi:hypothetical protein